MKVNIVPILIAVAISALLAYGLYALCKTDGQELLLAIGGFLCLFLSLATTMSVRFESRRSSANTALIGIIFFLLLLVSHAIFAFVHFSTPTYVIVNGILLLIFISVTYTIANSKQ